MDGWGDMEYSPFQGDLGSNVEYRDVYYAVPMGGINEDLARINACC